LTPEAQAILQKPSREPASGATRQDGQFAKWESFVACKPLKREFLQAPWLSGQCFGGTPASIKRLWLGLRASCWVAILAQWQAAVRFQVAVDHPDAL
jgi:hypothetical protein